MKFLSLPDQQDPDSYLRKEGREAFKHALEQAPRLPEKLFHELEQRYPLDHIANQSQFAHEALECIKLIPAGFYDDLMINALAEKLHLNRDQLKQLSSSTPDTKTTITPIPIKKRTGRIQITPAIEQANLLLLHHPSLITAIDPNFNVTQTDTNELTLLRQLLTTLRQQPSLTTGQLFAQFETTSLKPYVSQLASTPLDLSESSYENTLQETITHLQQQQYQHEADELLLRSKSKGLSFDEKKQLQHILMQMNKNKLG